MDLLFLIIIAQASITFVNSVGLFNEKMYAAPENQITTWTADNFSQMNTASTGTDATDYFKLTAMLLSSGFSIAMQLITNFVFAFDGLMKALLVPPAIRTLLQPIIFFIEIIFVVQMFWKQVPTEG
jgi:hypothetical protein